MKISVIIPTHNPATDRLRRTLEALAAQHLPRTAWELILVDNASDRPVSSSEIAPFAGTCVVREQALGLTAARRTGIAASRAPIIVFVDDDNVLAPDYLENVDRLFATHPKLGAIGGRIAPEFERSPEPWQQEFLPLLALRDLGNAPLISPTGPVREYPLCAPVGAGMAVRRAALLPWIESGNPALSDRRGRALTSGGDNDIVLSLVRAGWQVGYFPELVLTHLIPATRLAPAYLARLNRGIQRSWMAVLTRHQINPWEPIPRWTLPLRKIRAWFHHRAWKGPAAQIRCAGAYGHFEGRVGLSS